MSELYREQYIDAPIEKVWAFFSNTDNLRQITPANVHMSILHTQLPKEVHEGQVIVYKVRPIVFMSIVWVAKMKDVVPGVRFTDVQIKGPFKKWEHTHIFEKRGNGSVMKDSIYYEVPRLLPGFLKKMLGIERKLDELFVYRNVRIREIFKMH